MRRKSPEKTELSILIADIFRVALSHLAKTREIAMLISRSPALMMTTLAERKQRLSAVEQFPDGAFN